MRLTSRVLGLGVLLLAFVTFMLPGRVFADGTSSSFSIQSFNADYYLSRNSDKRSQMEVIETIAVRFLPMGENHGIERSIPDTYNGHPVHFKVDSVKNSQGASQMYSTYGSNGNTVVRIGDPTKEVSGTQTYVIDYELQDVTQQFKDHDEIYWDTNGTDWAATFNSVSAHLHLSGDLAKAFNGQTRCYEGVIRSTSECAASVVKKDNETVLTFNSSRFLYAGENVSFVVGFAPNTFTNYQPTAWERMRKDLLIGWFGLGALVLIAAMGAMLRAWEEYGESPEGKGTIVPEYIPPKDLSVMMSSAILKRKGSDVTAQIIDLAVRGYLKIYETKARGSWLRGKRSYELELTRKPTGLRDEEKRLLDILFGEKAKIGQRLTLEGMQSKLYKSTAQLEKEVETDARLGGYIAERTETRRHYYRIGGWLLFGGIITLNPGVALAGLLVLWTAANFHPLTEKGVERRAYLRGLEMYMKLAEAERIRYLQSPEGAVKTRVSTKNKQRLVQLYEHLLPYAIVFGMERQWAKEFAPLYTKAPDWYVGDWEAFNVGVFIGSLNSFSAVSNTAFTAPMSSSNSGFSAGSGFSGGGGGGGGGGAW